MLHSVVETQLDATWKPRKASARPRSANPGKFTVSEHPGKVIRVTGYGANEDEISIQCFIEHQ